MGRGRDQTRARTAALLTATAVDDNSINNNDNNNNNNVIVGALYGDHADAGSERLASLVETLDGP